MAKTSPFRQRGGAGEVTLNMTPMIDCVFQLIIFFVLATQAASAALAKVKLSRPHASQAIPSKDIESPNRVIVNVVSKAASKAPGEVLDPMTAAEADRYEVMKERIEVGDIERLVEVIKDRRARAKSELGEKAAEKDFFIEIRADKRINYRFVSPVIKAGVAAGVTRMSLTALPAS
jgi:biopolymer transport protein ExbD